MEADWSEVTQASLHHSEELSWDNIAERLGRELHLMLEPTSS